MKSFIVLALFVAAAVAAPAGSEADAQIVRLDVDNIGVEGYNYAVETSNNINIREQGQLQNVGTEDEGIEVQGEYSYPGPDGVIYKVEFTAGKDGFRPRGAHIPVA